MRQYTQNVLEDEINTKKVSKIKMPVAKQIQKIKTPARRKRTRTIFSSRKKVRHRENVVRHHAFGTW